MLVAASLETESPPTGTFQQDPQAFAKDLLPKLSTSQLQFFPIRHHSPACAAHVRHWIEVNRPASVLIEGPGSFDSMVDMLCDPSCRFPVAAYVNFVDHSGHLQKKRQTRKNLDSKSTTAPASPEEMDTDRKDLNAPARFSAYYPFCDYSPEAVALRHGRKVGARIRFIDLEYPEKILAAVASDEPPDSVQKPRQEGIRVESLTSDPHLTHSEYTRNLARRLGCRDFDELWDHLFEANCDAFDTDEFIRRVATYCAMTRLSISPEALHADGTLQREACMAAAIRDELDANLQSGSSGKVLVVTGGFHTVVLPDLVSGGKVRRPVLPKWKTGETGSWLMRYSFNQLDALSGYSSGMPSPAFYDRMWQSSPQTTGDCLQDNDQARTQAAFGILVEVARKTRERQFNPAITTPDVIAASQMVRQLAALRGHRWPQRQDLLDGIRSCFIKGEIQTEGRLLLDLVREFLAGNRVGEVPTNAGTPPIVDDFREQTRRLKLSTETIDVREMALDIYRNSRHREISRLFHRLSFLQIPFARFLRGPDFVQSVGLDLMQENWTVSWSPHTESNLIEASVFGTTINEAAYNRLRDQITLLEDRGEGRNTSAAVSVLMRACRMGLHEHLPRLMIVIDEHISEDPHLPSVVDGLTQMELLKSSLEPLEAAHLDALPHLMKAAYHRSCRLTDQIATCADDDVQPLMEALKSLREVLQSSHWHSTANSQSPQFEQSRLDPELFHQALGRIVRHPADQAQSPIVGAAAGLLYGDAILSADELVTIAAGYLGGALVDPQKSCGIVRGLLATAREIAWQVAEILQALDQQFNNWNEETFLQVLPELRLAFSDLTPREIANVAENVAGLHGKKDLGQLVHMDLDENEVEYSLRLSRSVKESLQEDGLWVYND